MERCVYAYLCVCRASSSNFKKKQEIRGGRGVHGMTCVSTRLALDVKRSGAHKTNINVLNGHFIQHALACLELELASDVHQAQHACIKHEMTWIMLSQWCKITYTVKLHEL
eukprot:1150028-Pelagomonas_calceolata.AAC.5